MIARTLFGRDYPRRPVDGPARARRFEACPLAGLAGWWIFASLALFPLPAAAQASRVVDLAAVPATDAAVRRVHGASGGGELGVPVAGGADCDGDGLGDYAVAFFTASPFERAAAGETDLIFGDGAFGGSIDTALPDPRVLRILGAAELETAGNEIWIDDVTGDGLGDLLICRQNFTHAQGRIGAGALTILAGSPALRARAAELRAVDLAAPPAELTLTTLVGARALDRLGIWVRTGDVTGDGLADVVVGADQEDLPGEENRGAVYLIRGGAHLASGQLIDLRDFGSTPLAGHIAKITPPPASARFHFGATCSIADLDGDGRGEVLAAAALARGGASVPAANAPPGSAMAFGGSPQGTLFIAWADNFLADPWPAGFTFDAADPPGTGTVIDGSSDTEHFGEEIVGGLDFDGDGRADLFVGDLTGDGSPEGRPFSGIGYVLYRAADLKGRVLDLDLLPADVGVTTILGPSPGALGGDSAAQGDFDADGFADLAFGSPHANPQGRPSAGSVVVFFGRPGGWPELVDTRPDELPQTLRLTEIQGAAGTSGTDRGDTLAYSLAAADLDADGLTDLVANEMLGNGLGPDTVDVGNLLLLGGSKISGGCTAGATTLCLNRERFAVRVGWRDFDDVTGPGRVAPAGSDDSGLFWFFDPDNWEVLVKVLDGCAINQHFWVFAAATTDVEYTLRVTDTESGVERSYFNTLGTRAAAITDTGAFPCP